MLGVAPDASHDEVKRAYAQLAFRWHPDRRADLDESARAQADWRMRECNAAWAALNSPAGRAAYDDELRAAGRMPGQPGDGVEAGARATLGRAMVGRVPSPTDQIVEPARDFGIMVPKRHTGRWVAAGVVVVLVVGAIVAGIAASQHDAPPPSDPELRTNAFQVGSCVSIQPGPIVASVPCTQPNAGRIASTTDYPRPCPIGSESLALVDEKLVLCLVSN